MAENKVTGSTIRKRIKQRSDVANTNNSVEDSDAEAVQQRIESQQNSLQVFGGKARGTIAVICLVVVIAAYLIYHYFAAHVK
jgi:hypothetical protein